MISSMDSVELTGYFNKTLRPRTKSRQPRNSCEEMYFSLYDIPDIGRLEVQI